VGVIALASGSGLPAGLGTFGRAAGRFGKGQVGRDLAVTGGNGFHHLGHHALADDEKHEAEENQHPEDLAGIGIGELGYLGHRQGPDVVGAEG
jgi:hypothetical protein